MVIIKKKQIKTQKGGREPWKTSFRARSGHTVNGSMKSAKAKPMNLSLPTISRSPIMHLPTSPNATSLYTNKNTRFAYENSATFTTPNTSRYMNMKRRNSYVPPVPSRRSKLSRLFGKRTMTNNRSNLKATYGNTASTTPGNFYGPKPRNFYGKKSLKGNHTYQSLENLNYSSSERPPIYERVGSPVKMVQNPLYESASTKSTEYKNPYYEGMPKINPIYSGNNGPIYEELSF